MRNRGLSFYTRRKLNHRFPQGTFLNPKEFVKFLKRHGIIVTEKNLEEYEREGWLQPAFRIVVHKQLQNGLLRTANDNIKRLYRNGSIELPKCGDYEPWDNFRANYKKGKRCDKKTIHYHQFQILQVKNIFDNKKIQFMYFDSYKKHDLEKIMANAATRKKINDERFDSLLLSETKNIGLLMLLEEPYRFYGFGSILLSYESDNRFELWKWRKKFSAIQFLKNNGFSEEQIRMLHREFVIRAHRLDPLKRWYDLIRIMRLSTIAELEGDALTAQLYYGIIRMLAQFLYELTGEKMDEPDLFFDSTGGEWKKDVYSNPFDYATRKTQRGIISKFVGDHTTRLFILVEGGTEEKVIKKIFERLNISITDDGIHIINCDGAKNMAAKKLKDTIRLANRDHIAMYVIADNEGNLESQTKIMQGRVETAFGYHIWDTSFEEDNFGKRKVVALINSYLKKYGQNLSYDETDAEQTTGKALVRSIEEAYNNKYRRTNKYHEKLYETIGISKPDISLKLMESRIEEIAPDSNVGTQTKIEKVLRVALDMIPIWR